MARHHLDELFEEAKRTEAPPNPFDGVDFADPQSTVEFIVGIASFDTTYMVGDKVALTLNLREGALKGRRIIIDPNDIHTAICVREEDYVYATTDLLHGNWVLVNYGHAFEMKGLEWECGFLPDGSSGGTINLQFKADVHRANDPVIRDGDTVNINWSYSLT